MSALFVDEEDAPEWSADVFDRAEVRRDGVLVRPAEGTLTRRGRPKLEHPKRQVTLRLDPDVIDYFRSAGPGWQGRINAALRRVIKAG